MISEVVRETGNGARSVRIRHTRVTDSDALARASGSRFIAGGSTKNKAGRTIAMNSKVRILLRECVRAKAPDDHDPMGEFRAVAKSGKVN